MPPPAHCADDLDDCGPMHPGQDCPPDPDNCGHCHCPGCGLIGGGPSGGLPGECPNFSRLHPSHDASARRLAFYYADRQPEAVSLPIWQPPKLGA